MELNHPTAGRQKRVSSRRSVDHQQDYYSGHGIKSFKCTFCKRGFSNAQALGGHMNIHRKDRAKLKFSVGTTTEEDDEVLPTVIDIDHSSSCREDVGMIVPRQEILQRPLFLEMQSTTHELQSFDGGRTESFMQWDYDPFPKLDLELRLGPDPEQNSRSKRRTRKFF